MQLMLDRSFGMQTSAYDLDMQGALSHMYAPPRSAPLYGLKGLGISVSDMVAACGGSGTGGCDPRDSGCVAVAQALNDWAQNELEANFPWGPSTMPPCPNLSNTAAITAAFMNNTPISLGPQSGPGTSIPNPAAGGTSPAIAATYNPPATVATATTPPATPVLPMSTGISNTGANLAANAAPAPASNTTPPAKDNTMLYVALAAGAALLFVMGQK